MGLASKLAAAGGAAVYSNLPGQQPPRPGNPPYPTNQQQYQTYPGIIPPAGYPPGQPGYGAAPSFPQQPGYGAPPSQLRPEAFRQSLQQTIQEKSIQNMFLNPAILDQICQAAPAKVEQLCHQWHVPREVGQDVAKLALFDIIIYVDDSGSMQFEENGERIQDMKLILAKVAFAASLFDSDGIEIRFMNSDRQGNNIRTEQEVEVLVSQIQFKGLTPMGTQLRNKVLEPLVVQRARSNQLRKPVLIITITDGQPAGEPTGAVFDAIRYASNELSRSPYGKGAISFQFAQVGNDLKAREFLGKLDNEPGVGELVDSTSNFEVEQDEMSRAQPPVDLTPDLWLLKLLLGAIDSSYDTIDEKGGRPSEFQGSYVAPGQQQYGANPPGQYGVPPPQQGQYGQQAPYGAPSPQQGYYGQPPPGQYGARPTQTSLYEQQSQNSTPPPQQGQYGQYGTPASQYGQPGQHPSQGQQGYPPPGGQTQGGRPQGGYPGQQSYNKPPPRY